MSAARSVHDPDQATFSRILQTRGGRPGACRYAASSCGRDAGIAESLLGKRKRQYEQQGDDTFPGNGRQRGESAELRRLRQQLAQVTMGRDVLKRHSPSSRNPRSEVPRHRRVGRSLSRSADVPAAPGIPQRLLCLAEAATFSERDGESASEQVDPHYPP